MARTFVGPNSFALKRALRELKTGFTAEHGELALEVIDAEEADIDKVIEAAQSVPFLARKKMVVVHSLSVHKEAAERIEEILKAAEGTDLILVESKVDKRGSYYKYLQTNTKMHEFKEPDERQLAAWLVEEAKKAGAKLSLNDANYLLQRIGGRQEPAYNELNKLIDYDKDITKANIEKLTEASPQTNVFNLLDSAFSGNHKKTIRIYEEQRIQGEEPLKILGMLTWQMHQVALVDSAKGRSDKEIVATSGLKPFTLNKSRSIARKMGRPRIKKVLSELVGLDRQLKSTTVDADDALKNLLISL
ncbi:MAG TPA: DNA polymerase III subunit delta [Candidatus Saccharimonadales bacterium]|nr:DNA polymerase III subunit delta [Candidatus Saccharimonadales bacterium]